MPAKSAGILISGPAAGDHPQKMSLKALDVDPLGLAAGLAGSLHSLNSATSTPRQKRRLHHLNEATVTKAEPDLEVLPSSPSPKSSKKDNQIEKIIILIASFFSSCLIGGFYMGFGILYPEIVNEFQSGYGIAGWIGSVSQALGMLLGVVYGKIVDRWGCSKTVMIGALISFLGHICSAFAKNIMLLFFTYGIITGAAMGIIFLSNIVIVHQHFDRHRALASGLSLSGLSVGTISAALYQYLIEQYGWRGAVMIMGAVMLHGVPFGMLYKAPKIREFVEEDDSRNDEALTANSSNSVETGMLSTLKQIPFLLYCIGTFLETVGVIPFYTHTPSRARFYGIEHSRAASLVFITGITTLITRIFGGFVANLKCVNRTVQYGSFIVIGGLVNLCYFLSTSSYVQLAVHCALFGLCNGMFLTVQSTVIVDLLSVQELAGGQGILGIFMGSGFMLGTPVAGFIFDATQNYNLPFFISGSLEIFGGVIILSLYILLKVGVLKLKRQNENNHDLKS